MSAEGKVFYINHTDKTTHWTRPDPPPVQPHDSPAEDLPPSEAVTSMGSAYFSSGNNYSPFPANGGGGVDAAVASPALSGDFSARENSAGLSAEDDVVAPRQEEEEEEEEVFKVAAAAAHTEVEAAVLEEVAHTSIGSVAGTGVDIDPRVAPSATVVADADATEEPTSTSRSMGASPTMEAGRSAMAAAATSSTASARGREEAAASLEAASSNAGDDPAPAEEAGQEEGAGAGPVSSIVKSGLFGATVARPGGSGPTNPVTSGSNGDMSRSVAKRSNSTVPNYASTAAGALNVSASVAEDKAGGGVRAGAGTEAWAAGKPEPEVDALPEGRSCVTLAPLCVFAYYMIQLRDFFLYCVASVSCPGAATVVSFAVYVTILTVLVDLSFVRTLT